MEAKKVKMVFEEIDLANENLEEDEVLFVEITNYANEQFAIPFNECQNISDEEVVQFYANRKWRTISYSDITDIHYVVDYC